MTPAQRWRFVGEELRGGRRVAVLEDRHAQPGQPEHVRVFFRLGRWRLYSNDQPASHNAAACARRGLANQTTVQGDAVPLEELGPDADEGIKAEAVRLFEAPRTTPGQLTMGGGE